MGMTVYLFDKWQKVRRIIPENGVTELVHDEGGYALTAKVAADLKVITGEYLGFKCVDGHFRLFEVTAANLDDARHVQDITATDAIVAELKGKIIEDLQQIDTDLATAIKGILPEEEWRVIGQAPDRKENSRAYFTPAWTMLQTFAQLYEWRITPYYEYADGKINQKIIELQEDKAFFRGRILKSRKNAVNVYVTNNGRPITRLYGLGPAQGSRDVQTNMTFADVEWSTAKGDPVDKPKGQTWVGDPAAEDQDGIHYAVVYLSDAKDEEDLLRKTREQLQTLRYPVVKADATIADMEMVPGHTHEQIRLGDLVVIWLDAGYSVEARIISIKRDYIHRGRTKILIGSKKDTIQTQVADLIASATHTFERLTVYQNRFLEDEELIQLNAAVIQLNAQHIQENAESIIQHAEWILSQAELIELKANQDDMDIVVLRLNATEGSLTAQADTITAQGQLIQANAESIIAQAEEIYLKADKTYVDNLIAEAAKITDLDSIWGEITNLKTGLAEFLILQAGTVNASDVNTTYLDADAFTHAGSLVSQRQITMGEVRSVGSALSTGGVLDLQHSHKVTVNADGTLSLGEVASTGGTFNIADTQFFKDGVSAAYNRGMLEHSASELILGTPVYTRPHEYTFSITIENVYGNYVKTFTGFKIDARDAYDDGYADGYQAAIDALDVTAGITWSNPAQNWARISYWASVKIDGVEVGSASGTESKDISGFV